MEEKLISKYTLKFKSTELELLYQSQTFEKKLKHVYYLGQLFTLLLSLMQSILRIVTQEKIPYLNLGFVLATILNIFVLYKKEKYAQFALTLENAYVLTMQLNFVDPNTTNQEYFSYGSLYASLSTGLCFVQDFQYSCPSIVIQIIFRYIVTAYFSGHFNITLFFLSLFSMVIVISVLYICNRAHRLQFLMIIKDETIDKQLENIISSPFSKFKYNEDKLFLDVQLIKQPEQMIGYSEKLCQGCNLRNILRIFKFKGISLEQGLINHQIPINKSFIAKFKKIEISVRICKFSIDNSLIFIQERIINQRLNINHIPQKVQQKLKQHYSYHNQTPANIFSYFGMMSVLYMHNQEVRAINLTKLLKNLIQVYHFKEKVNMPQNHIIIKTYSCQLKIFLIQVFNIVSEIEIENNPLKEIHFTQFEACLIMKLHIRSPESFFFRYRSNFFVQQIQEHLLLTSLTYDLEFIFIKQIPFRINQEE